MRAIVYTEYGSPDVLRLVEIEKPAPTDDEVRVRVRAASVNALDWHLLRGRPLLMRPAIGGLLKPKATRPGADVAGVVDVVGSRVTRFKPGDEVFGAARGTFAEYVCVGADRLALKPGNISFEAAAAVPVAATTALQGLRDHGRIQRGQQVLVDGASGGVGTFAVQIARSFGAEVTAACSAGNMDTMRSLGAGRVVDYARDDVTRSGRRFDLILAANARHSIIDYRRSLTPDGTYVLAGGGGAQLIQGMLVAPLLSRLGRRRYIFFIAKIGQSDLERLRDLLAAGTITPVIDRRYPLSEAADAIRYVEAGHARGKVVISVEP